MLHKYMAEATKYKIIWALRSLEEELNNSNGVIMIEWENFHDKCNVYAKKL